MAIKRLIPFGLSRTDAIVREWLESKNINPNDVRAYRITRDSGNLPMIELTMFFEEGEDGLPA